MLGDIEKKKRHDHKIYKLGELKKIRIPRNIHSTNCAYCSKTCHKDCGLSKIEEKGSEDFLNCLAFPEDKIEYKRSWHSLWLIKDTFYRAECRECGCNITFT